MDFSAHTTPYVLTTYAVSIIAIAALIAWRLKEFRAAKRDDARHKKKTD